MKKVFLFMLFIVSLFFTVSCGINPPLTEPTKEPTIEEVNPFQTMEKEYYCYSGDEFELPKSFENVLFDYSAPIEFELNVNTLKVPADFTGEIIIDVKWKSFEDVFRVNVTRRNTITVETTDVEVIEGEEFEIKYSFSDKEEAVNFEYEEEEFLFNNNKFKAIKAGTFTIKLVFCENSYTINVKVNEKKEYSFDIEDFEIFVGEEIDLPITIISGTLEELSISSKSNVISLDGLKVKGIEEGVAALTITLGDKTRTIEVNVKDLEIEVLNESLDVDYFETLELLVSFPEFLNDNLVFNVSDETVLTVENGICYPNKIGKTRIKIYLENHPDVSKSIIVNVTVDPVAIMKSFMLEEALMKKVIKTYGSTVMEQSLLGSVSKYYFGELNLIENIIPYSSEQYVGVVATEELLKQLDETGLVRSGIKQTKINYITYHDTANNTVGADAENHWRYLTGDYNRTTRARSWHYTVDDKRVIQNIPDDEVTWQGDHFIAYSQSIGIETCINYGINLDIVWHRMGKLCGKLMERHGLNMSSIKQHYDWNRKECPHTLRANNLYSYALAMIEAEWIVMKCLQGYTITFESLTPDYLSNDGQIKKAPEVNTIVSYRITITSAKGYNESFEGSCLVKPLE